MANELKSKTPKAVEKPEKKEKAEKVVKEEKAAKEIKAKKADPAQKKATGSTFKAEKEEKVDLKKLAKDERTQKIMGTVSLLVATFLFISFISYFSTWKEDQSQIFNKGISFLFDNDSKV